MRILRILLPLTVAVTVRAEFPAPYNTERDQGSPMTAAEAAHTMSMPPGFRTTLFAAEPEVQNPIAMAWDHRGRLWIAENYTYAERPTRFDLALRDRVLIFEDKDNDGRADSRKVFTDDVQMLTSIEVGRGGVWLLCPPQLLFVPDANGDDVPDGAPQVVLDGFTVAKDNYHNFANGLHWGPDGWLYGRCGHSCPGRLGVPGTPDEQRVPIQGGIWRYHPDRRVVEVLTHGTTNPWGHDWDRYGEGFFINTVTGHLWHLMPGAHLKDSYPSQNPDVYARLDTIADHYHYDTHGGRGALSGRTADALGGGHAHIGMMIYQADQWPAPWRDSLFTLNLHGRRTNVERLERSGCGYIGLHQEDVFRAADEWFRGIDLSTGPDGSAFIIDWSDIGECHESTGVHRTSGRIFKVTYGTPAKPPLADLDDLSADGLRRLIANPNVWYERQARVLLGTQRDAPPGVADALEKLVASDAPTVTRLRALWALNAVPLRDPQKWRALLRGLLRDNDEHVRVWTIRLLTDDWPLDTIVGPLAGARADTGDLLPDLVSMARGDASGLVRLTLASTLQRLPVSQRRDLAVALAARNEDAQDRDQPSMVWFGIIPLARENPDAVLAVAKVCCWPDTVRWIARQFAGRMETDAAPLNALLAQAASGQRPAILQGMGEACTGWQRAPKPAAWDTFAKAARTGDEADAVRDLNILFGDGRALDEVKGVALDASAEPAARTMALNTLIEARPPDLRALCESLLDVRVLNATAARGLALFDDPAIGATLAKSYRKFQPAGRLAILDTLASRPEFAKSLLDEIGAGRIPRADLTAFHARQIRALKNDALTGQLTEVWGELHESAADKQQLIARLKAMLGHDALKKADPGKGRVVFQTVCAVCHTMYGTGGRIGPDLTGSNRGNLDYLLENIADPSAVVSADYRMTTLNLKDGRTLSGVAGGRNERTMTLRTLTGEITVRRGEVVAEEVSSLSMMPDGLIEALQPDQVRDLFAYLLRPTQVPLPDGARAMEEGTNPRASRNP